MQRLALIFEDGGVEGRWREDGEFTQPETGRPNWVRRFSARPRWVCKVVKDTVAIPKAACITLFLQTPETSLADTVPCGPQTHGRPTQSGMDHAVQPSLFDCSAARSPICCDGDQRQVCLSFALSLALLLSERYAVFPKAVTRFVSPSLLQQTGRIDCH